MQNTYICRRHDEKSRNGYFRGNRKIAFSSEYNNFFVVRGSIVIGI